MGHLNKVQSRASALDHFKKYKAMVEKQIGKKLRRVRCDDAKKLVQGKFKEYLSQEGILLDPTAPYSPAQNGIAERLNRVLLEHAHAMFLKKKLPKFLWEDAVAYACSLRRPILNRSPARASYMPVAGKVNVHWQPPVATSVR